MKAIFTRKNKDNLVTELKRIEEFAIKDSKIQDTYFPYTVYEVEAVLEKAIWLEIEYKDTEFWTKIK